MARTARVVKSAEAVALADHIRWIAAIWEGRTGFVCRPRHEKRQIVVGHADYATDPEVASNVDALLYALDRLGNAESVGYTILPLHEDPKANPPAAWKPPAPVAVKAWEPSAPTAALAQGSLF